MNPVAITFIHPRKEHWPNQGSNLQPAVLKSCMLQTEPHQLGNPILCLFGYKLLFPYRPHSV